MDKHKILLYLGDEMAACDLIVEEEVSSSNDLAKELALQGRTPVVIACSQTAGRGRMGRSFSSARGGLYLSMVYRPRGSVQEQLSLTPLAALALHDALEAVHGIPSRIKWPNDLLVQGKKVAGILTEAVHLGSTYFIVLGLGLNLTNPLEEDLPQAGNLASLTGVELEPERLAAQVIRQLQALFTLTAKQRAACFSRYRSHCATLGQPVRVTSGTEVIEGIAEDVDDGGALLVRQSEGDRVRVFTGEATLR